MSQFTDADGNLGLGSIFDLPKNVYPVGRLDLDSEGLLILTNDPNLNDKLLNPRNMHGRTYFVEVDGIPSAGAVEELKRGVMINVKGTFKTRPAVVHMLPDFSIDEREPPVNRLKHPMTSWLSITITEGKNRQVRKMTAKIGHPTLRLIRTAIEDLKLGPLKPGELTQLSRKAVYSKLNIE